MTKPGKTGNPHATESGGYRRVSEIRDNLRSALVHTQSPSRPGAGRFRGGTMSIDQPVILDYPI
jgi:hypothetical protein